jgi:hypothetical protein
MDHGLQTFTELDPAQHHANTHNHVLLYDPKPSIRTLVTISSKCYGVATTRPHFQLAASPDTQFTGIQFSATPEQQGPPQCSTSHVSPRGNQSTHLLVGGQVLRNAICFTL